MVYSRQNIKEHLKGYMKECMKNTKKDKKTLMLKLLVQFYLVLNNQLYLMVENEAKHLLLYINLGH